MSIERKQKEIPGFERHVENPAVEEAARKYCQIRNERAAQSKKEKQAQLELLATMRANGLERYEYLDDDAGEILEARIVIAPEKAEVVKTGAPGATSDGWRGRRGSRPSLLALGRRLAR